MQAKKTGSLEKFRKILSIAGLIALGWLIYRIGVEDLLINLSRFGFWLLATVLLGTLWLFLQSLAWRIIQGTFSLNGSVWLFFRVKIISEALNTVLPSANLGGDMARAYLIRSQVPLNEGIAGVLVDKTFEFFGGMLFMALGLGGSFFIPRKPSSLIMAAAICLGATLAGIALLIILQFCGVSRILNTLLGRFAGVRAFLERRQDVLCQLDRNLRHFYAKGGKLIFTAAGLHFAARLLGAVEILLIMRVLGVDLGFSAALFIGAMVTAANTIFFVMPGQLGISEGANVLALESLGIGGEIGLGIGVIRRIRRMVLVVAGLFLFSRGKGKNHESKN